MKGYTFDNLKFDKNAFKDNSDTIYNIHRDTIMDARVPRGYAIVLENEEMRLDLLSKRLYGTTSKVEELMVVNNIINPWSIKQGDVIRYILPDNLYVMQKLEIDEDNATNIVTKTPNKNKGTRVDPNRKKGVIPTIRPVGLENVTVDKSSQEIKLNGKLQ